MKIEEIEPIIETIKKNIAWYNGIDAGYQAIDNLQKVADIIVTNNFYLAELLAEAKTGYVYDILKRKVAINATANNLSKEKSVSKSELEAKAIHSQLYDNEAESEALAYRVEILHKQANKVVDCIQSRIVTLRKEIEYQKSIKH